MMARPRTYERIDHCRRCGTPLHHPQEGVRTRFCLECIVKADRERECEGRLLDALLGESFA
jgi:hypothetical protein